MKKEYYIQTLTYKQGPILFVFKRKEGEEDRLIGDVSPEAIWVKPGDELGIEDLGWICDDGSGDIIPFTKLKQDWDEDEEEEFDDLVNAMIAIRSPMSNTFH